MYHSDLVLLLEAVLSGFSLLVLLKWCVPEASPLQIVWGFAREHAMSRRSLFYLLTLLGIMFLDIAEVRYDGVITQHLGGISPPFSCGSKVRPRHFSRP